MATTDHELIVQRPLAEFAYDLKAKYNQTHGMNKADFMAYYDTGEIQLSSVYENLFVTVNNALGGDATKTSDDHRDFSNNGDMKIGNLKVDDTKGNYYTRYQIKNVYKKLGVIYFVGNNWIKNKIHGKPMPDFYAFPNTAYATITTKVGSISIPRCPITGERRGGKYNFYSYPTFEEMVMANDDPKHGYCGWHRTFNNLFEEDVA